MKKSITIFLTIYLFSSSNIYSQNWYPLEVGNKWQYISYVDWTYSGNDSQLINVEVVGDTIIHNNLYYWARSKITGLLPNDYLSLVRYDIFSQKLFSFSSGGDTACLEMDFNLEAGDMIPLTIPWMTEQRIVIEGSDLLFGEDLSYKGYDAHGFGNYIKKYAEDYGLYYSYTFDYWGIRWEANSYLIQSILNINDSIQIHSHPYYPEIIYSPINSFQDSSFQISFQVNHHFSTYHNYIDTVYFESYYSNNDSSVENQTIIANYNSDAELYYINLYLNLNLLTNGYNFYYRIKAIDKGLTPHITFSPDSGYYRLVYDTTTSVRNFML